MNLQRRFNEGDTNFTSIFEKLFTADEKTGRPAADADTLTAEAILTVSAGMDTTGMFFKSRVRCKFS